jgi:glycosyltransferase involved in cell wall biosynthesis
VTKSTSRLLRTTHVVASIVDAGAGPTYSVSALCRNLAAHDAVVRLRSVDGWRASPGQTPPPLPDVEVTQHPQSAGGLPLLSSLCMSASLRRSLDEDARTSEVLHAHGLWLMPNIYPARAVRRPGARAKLVISPRGMLGAAALSFSSGKKQLFWRAFQASAMRAASCLHATSEAEFEEIRRAGLRTPVAIIPNGVDIPAGTPPGSESRVAVSLGRVHPKKGLDRLVRAWASVEAEQPGWALRIIGPAELGYDAELRALAASLNLSTVTIEPPLFGAEKLAALREAELFVLPTLNENFAMTVAEALAAGTPVISTKGAPWAGLEHERCGWWVDHGVDAMSAALREALSLSPQSRAEMGARGRAWMERDFGWSSVAGNMLDVYRWLAGQGAPPPHIRFE